MLAGQYVQPGLLPDEQLAPSQSRITLRAEGKALRVKRRLYESFVEPGARSRSLERAHEASQFLVSPDRKERKSDA